MKNLETVICEEFSRACDDKYGIHGMILYKHPENLFFSDFKWRSYTYYDFAREIIMEYWGVTNYSEMMDVFDHLDFMENSVKIVYSRNGYYPGNYYVK